MIWQQSPPNPTNPYAATKAAAEMLVSAYRRSFQLPLIVCRGSNVYGPRQYPEKAVPKFILRALAGAPLRVHGTGEQLRAYLYVEDAVEAYVAVLRAGGLGEVYNVGPDLEISVNALAAAVLSAVAPDGTGRVEHVEDRPFNDQRYLMDASKLRSLGWRPRVGWEEGLAGTVEWYRGPESAAYWPDGWEAALDK